MSMMGATLLEAGRVADFRLWGHEGCGGGAVTSGRRGGCGGVCGEGYEGRCECAYVRGHLQCPVLRHLPPNRLGPMGHPT